MQFHSLHCRGISPRRLKLCGVYMLWSLAAGLSALSAAAGEAPRGPVDVTDYLGEQFVTDGSVSYQGKLQQALDEAARSGRDVVFPPMRYLLDDPQGLRIASGMTLHLRGATLLLSPEMAADGQALRGENVSDVTLLGGTIVGRNDRWPPGVNLRGVYLTGACQRIVIRGMHLRDLTSNGIGVFGGSAEAPVRDVWLLDTVIDNCCNVYGDYSAAAGELRGPEKGSVREDQGSVAFYYVEEFVVRGCRFDNSRSDGTHFFGCRNGQFSDNRVYGSKMGGYFLEACEHILAVNNIIRDNGSRGVTIERGSRACTLVGNTVENSGREGLWIPNCSACVVSDNIFIRNGRKPNERDNRQRIWNANITVSNAPGTWTDAPTENYLITDNIIDTGADQIAAIRVATTPSTSRIVLRGNMLLGENTEILVEGENPGAVLATENDALGE